MKNTKILEKHISNLEEYRQKEISGISVLKIDDILLLLNSLFLENSIEFVITGGVALDFYTGAQSFRKDIDLIIKLQNTSLDNIINIFSELFGNPEWFYLQEQITYNYNTNKIKESGIWHHPYVVLHNSSAVRIDVFIHTPTAMTNHAIEQKKYTTLMNTNIPIVSTEYSILTRMFAKIYYKKSNEYDRMTQNFINKVLYDNTLLDVEFMTKESRKLNMYDKFIFMMETARIINSTSKYTNVLNNIV